MIRKQAHAMGCEKGILKNFGKFKAIQGPATLFRKRLRQKCCFRVNFLKFYRAHFLENFEMCRILNLLCVCEERSSVHLEKLYCDFFQIFLQNILHKSFFKQSFTRLSIFVKLCSSRFLFDSHFIKTSFS